MFSGWLLYSGTEVGGRYAGSMANVCSGPECTRTKLAKSEPPLCRSHYQQYMEGRPLTRFTPPLPEGTICVGPDCDRPARALKDPPLCMAHYYQHRKGQGLHPINSHITPTCTVEGCDRPHSSRRMCKMHVQRWRKWGDPLAVRPEPRQVACKEPGCTGSSTHRYCEDHRAAANGACAADGCQQVALSGQAVYCETHARRDRTIRHFYGMSLRQRDAILREQDGRCAICRCEVTLHIDHDHQTGTVRGMLCGPCNRGLGLFRDDPARLLGAVDYLRRGEAAADV